MRPIAILLSPLGDHKTLLKRLRQQRSYAEDTVYDTFFHGECSFSVQVDGRILDDFEENEKAYLNATLGEFSGVGVIYPGVDCIRSLLQEVLPGLAGFLDTDYDRLISYEAVIERFQIDPSWDWRHW